MAETTVHSQHISALKRIFQVIRVEKNEITSIYFYAILSGLIQLSLPLGIQSIISFVLGGSLSTSLIVLIILVVAGVFFTGLLQVNQMKLIEKIQQKIFVRYAFAFVDRIPKLNLYAVDHYYLPELINRFFDTVLLQKGISKLLLDIPAATIQIFFGLILLSFYHPIFIFFGISLITIVVLIIRLTGGKGLSTSLQESNYKYAVISWLEEVARVVKSFKFSRKNTLHIEKTDGLVTGYLNSRTSHFKILLIQYWSLITFKILITAAMLIVGSILLVDQQLNIGQFIASEIVILMVITSVEKIIINLDKVYDVLTSVEKLAKVIDKPIEKNGTLPLSLTTEGVSIEINNVTFVYEDDVDNKILKNISLSIQRGEKICLMGPPGSGKSTLIKLLTGSYPTYEGNILINNLSLANYDLESLRTNTGILISQQDIFNGTLLENITMGNKTISIDQILYLSQKLNLNDFFNELKDGFDTHLDPAGKRLSRKITHKILLLRALIDSPQLLLLEEPFDVDMDTRLTLVDYLFTLKSTVIVTSNDLELAKKFDKVAYINDGLLKAYGKWDDIKNSL